MRSAYSGGAVSARHKYVVRESVRWAFSCLLGPSNSGCRCCFVLAALSGSELSQALAARKLPCDDVCYSLKRAVDFGAAVFGSTGRPSEVCPYNEEMLVHTYQNPALVAKCEAKIRAFVSDPTQQGTKSVSFLQRFLCCDRCRETLPVVHRTY